MGSIPHVLRSQGYFVFKKYEKIHVGKIKIHLTFALE